VFLADLSRATRDSINLSVDGERVRERGGGENVSMGSLTLDGGAALLVRPGLDAAGHPRAWGLTAQADVHPFTADLPDIAGTRSFLRLGASLGAFYLSPARNLYSLQAGAFVAEQDSLMGSPHPRPFGRALGTYRANDELVFQYGFGYTYDLGRGLPLPFLGLDWAFAPDWSLDVFLPVLATVNWRVSKDVTLTFGSSAPGDFFEYRAQGDPNVEDLRISRLRLGASGRVALAHHLQLGMGIGLERASIDGPSNLVVQGAYAQVTFGYVFGAGLSSEQRRADESASRRGGW
jgi:hypothetical protein